MDILIGILLAAFGLRCSIGAWNAMVHDSGYTCAPPLTDHETAVLIAAFDRASGAKIIKTLEQYRYERMGKMNRNRRTINAFGITGGILTILGSVGAGVPGGWIVSYAEEFVRLISKSRDSMSDVLAEIALYCDLVLSLVFLAVGLTLLLLAFVEVTCADATRDDRQTVLLGVFIGEGITFGTGIAALYFKVLDAAHVQHGQMVLPYGWWSELMGAICVVGAALLALAMGVAISVMREYREKESYT